MARIKLGNRYRDRYTAFEGRATARYEFENGCVRYELTADELHEGKPVMEVFDEQRLETARGSRPRATASAGGPREAPAGRHRTPSG